MKKSTSKIAQLRDLINATISLEGPLDHDSATAIVKTARESLGIMDADSRQCLKKEFGYVFFGARRTKTTATTTIKADTATVVSSPKPLSKIAQLRAKIAENITTGEIMTPEQLVDFAINDIGYIAADARYFVKAELGANFPGWADKPAKQSAKQPAKQPAKLSKIAQLRAKIAENITTGEIMTPEQLVDFAINDIGYIAADARYFVKAELGSEFPGWADKPAKQQKTPSEQAAAPSVKLSKIARLRAKFAELEAADETMTPEQLVDFAINDIGYIPADARYYVKKEFGGNFPGWAKADGTTTQPKSEAPKLTRAQKKIDTGKLRSINDVQVWFKELGIECSEFDGITLKTAIGDISMAFGDFFLTRLPENVTDGRPVAEVLSPTHLRRLVLGDNSPIGKLNWV